MLRDDLEEWDEGAGWEGGDICIHVADSLCYTAETNTTLLSSVPPLFKKVIKCCYFKRKSLSNSLCRSALPLIFPVSVNGTTHYLHVLLKSFFSFTPLYQISHQVLFVFLLEYLPS